MGILQVAMDCYLIIRIMVMILLIQVVLEA
jgi:hypothetical protein